MKDNKNIGSCAWAYRFELLGLILLVIATLLTIFTWNSVGIAAMFLVALVLCGHKCLCNKCSSMCHTEDELGTDSKQDSKPTVNKSNVNKTQRP